MASETDVIRLEGIGRDYLRARQVFHALKDIHLRVNPGSSLAIAGPSGSGKSTLLNIIGTMERPSHGRIHINGQDLTPLTDNQRADFRERHIGFVFQRFNLIATLNARDNLALVLTLRGSSLTSARTEARRWLDRLGLSEEATLHPYELSAGQQQRLAIARAMIKNPTLLIADEPSANLDTPNTTLMLNLLQSLQQETGVTMIIATHDPRILTHIPTHVTMQDGRIIPPPPQA